MTTYNTGNPIGSTDPRDLYDNAQNYDFALNSLTEAIWLDRFGVGRRTWYGLEVMVADAAASYGIITLSGVSFTTGATVNLNEALLNTANNTYYKWTGSFPAGGKVVPQSSTPESTGGIGPGKWLSVGDTVLRNDLAKPTGASMVGTTSGKTVQQEIDNLYSTINFIPQRCTHASNLLVDGNAIIIECFGDSTMWGSIPGATTTQDPKNSVAELQTTLNLLFPGKATVRNKALPGTNLESLLNGTDGGPGTFDDRMAASDALVIYSNHCLNDCNSYQSDEAEYKSNLYKWVNIVRKYNKIPVIVTPSIISPTDDGKEYQQKRMPAFLQAQRDVAAEMNVDLVDNFYYSYKTSRMYKVTDIAGDGVHLTQASYQAAGRNLAIPLLEPHFLNKPGDLSGLATSYWKDTITNARAIFKVDSRFGSVLSGDSIATPQNIYYPVVLDNPTDDTTIAFGGLQGTGGGYGVFTYSGANGDARFSGIIDFKRSNSQDYDALFIPKICKLGAGLHILGVLSSTGLNGLNFTFGGAMLLPRREVSAGYPDGTGRTQSRLICTGDEIRFSAYFAKDASSQVAFSLKGNLYTDTSNALVINNALGVLTMVAGGVTTNIGTLTQSGFQDCRIVLNDDRTISVSIGGFSATSTAMSASLPTCYVSSPGVYSVRKP